MKEKQFRQVQNRIRRGGRRRAVAKGYTWADLSITSVDNPNTIIMADHLGAAVYKRWQVYRKYI